MAKAVIIALDFGSAQEALSFLGVFKEEKPYVKIGMELFYKEGPDIVAKIKDNGHCVFLDLKLYDIPNTVEKAMRSLRALNVDMLNLHAGGGSDMMQAALTGITREDGTRPLIIAVTMLTSIGQDCLRDELLITAGMEKTVSHYAKNAMRSGLDGIVCSPLEARNVKDSCGEAFLAVTPGIRFANDNAGDQARIATPALAGEMGSDYIVVGRSITDSRDPVAAYRRCVNEFFK